MLRRLFFLFPDEKHAQRVVRELVNNNIAKRHIHAIAHGVRLYTLPAATERQKKDTAFLVEKLLWIANLLLFSIAFIGLIMALVSAETLWVAVAIFVMLATFIAGELFVVYIPDVHLSEFSDALSHGEILLMVDVPKNQVAEIEHLVHRHHPEAAIGGVGWTLDAFGI
jgi:hypothetical protein